mgnify:CR=1 FL=1
MYNTFNGWKRFGRAVRLGERGCFRNEYGDYMFHESQTNRAAHKKITTYRDRYGNVVSREVTYL